MGRDDNPIRRAFAPVIGLPAWNVRKGYGSFLILEFGQPRLKIREPIIAPTGVSERVRTAMARRIVTPRGDWHLWIYCCHWRVLSKDAQLAWSEASDEKINDAAREIDGQLLTGIETKPAVGTSVFRFDQGTRLETRPYEDDDNDKQWMLYMKSGDVFSYRADGYYSWGPGNRPEDDVSWHPLPSGTV